MIRFKPIPKKRSKPRRGEPTLEEKEQLREDVYIRDRGLCQAKPEDRSPDHADGVLPFAGHVLSRAHLAHKRTRRVHGWAMENLELNCPACHNYHHAGKKPCPPKPKGTT